MWIKFKRKILFSNPYTYGILSAETKPCIFFFAKEDEKVDIFAPWVRQHALTLLLKNYLEQEERVEFIR